MSMAGQTPGVIDDIGEHITADVPLEKAAVPLGVYFSWCANLQLLHPDFAADHETEVLRLRMREHRPGEFFIRTTGGRLTADQLNERGRLFAERCYPDYLRAYGELVGLSGDHLFEAADSWDTYDRVAPWLTRHYYAFADAGHKAKTAGVRANGKKRWWQVWRGAEVD